MTSEIQRTSPLQDQAKEAGEKAESLLPFDLGALKEMLPQEAQKIETNGSFYGGTLERAWMYRKLCEFGFITDETRSTIEKRRLAFHERKEPFSFEQSFREMPLIEQTYLNLLSRALFLAEEGILSQEELENVGQRLGLEPRENVEAFFARKQYDAELAFTKGTFSLFSLCSSYQLKELLPLHLAFQSLPSRGKPRPFLEEKEKSYLCMKLGILAFGEKRVPLLSLAEFEDIDSKLAALNTIRRARVLGIITSQDHAKALAAGLGGL